MALISVHPSRGSKVFFALVAMAALGSKFWKRHETRVINRDGPVAVTAQNLALCLFGPDVNTLLPNDYPEPLEDEWRLRISEWLRAAVTAPQPNDWPARCLPSVSLLEQQLRHSRVASRRMYSAVYSVSATLDSTRTGDLTTLTQECINGIFPSRLAIVFSGVRAMSLGTRDRWQPVIPDGHRWNAPRLPDLPSFRRDFPPYASRVVLIDPSSALWLSTADGMTHRQARFNETWQTFSVGPVIPRDLPAHDGFAWAESDTGPSLITPGLSPRVLPLPDGVVPTTLDSVPSFGWDATRFGNRVIYLGLDSGTVRVTSSPLDGPVSWSPPTLVGPAESVLSATVSTTPDGPRVTLLRPRANDMVFEAFRLRLDPSPSGSSPITADNLNLHLSVAASDARAVATCTADSVRWIVVAGSLITFFRIDGSNITTVQNRNPAQRRPSKIKLQCDARRALFVARDDSSQTTPSSVLLAETSPNGSSTITPLVNHPSWETSRVWDYGLITDSVLAFVQSNFALRAWRWANASQWLPSALISTLTPSRNSVRTFTRVDTQSQGDFSIVALEGTLSTRTLAPSTDDNTDDNNQPQQRWNTTEQPFRTLAVSSNSGVSFSTH